MYAIRSYYAFGGISFAQKAGMGIAGAAVGLLLDFFGYIPDGEQSKFALMGLALMLTVIPGVFHAIMGRITSYNVCYTKLLRPGHLARH